MQVGVNPTEIRLIRPTPSNCLVPSVRFFAMKRSLCRDICDRPVYLRLISLAGFIGPVICTRTARLFAAVKNSREAITLDCLSCKYCTDQRFVGYNQWLIKFAGKSDREILSPLGVRQETEGIPSCPPCNIAIWLFLGIPRRLSHDHSFLLCYGTRAIACDRPLHALQSRQNPLYSIHVTVFHFKMSEIGVDDLALPLDRIPSFGSNSL